MGQIGVPHSPPKCNFVGLTATVSPVDNISTHLHDACISMMEKAAAAPAPPQLGEQLQLQQVTTTDTQQLKELLYKAEAQRLRVQQQAAGLTQSQQALTADAKTLRTQLAGAHAAFAASQQQLLQLSDVQAKLTLQVKAATAEYRGNDIICIGLRSTISALQQQLHDSRSVCAAQVRHAWRDAGRSRARSWPRGKGQARQAATGLRLRGDLLHTNTMPTQTLQIEQLAGNERDTAMLRQSASSMSHALETLQGQHDQLLQQHSALQQEHEQASRDMQSMRT